MVENLSIFSSVSNVLKLTFDLSLYSASIAYLINNVQHIKAICIRQGFQDERALICEKQTHAASILRRAVVCYLLTYLSLLPGGT